MPGLLAHALKQQTSLPVARLLVLVHTASQLFKLAASRSLKDGLACLAEWLPGSPGEDTRLPREDFLCHLGQGLFCSHETLPPSAYSSLLAAVISL
jgi:hypothetical protein